MYDVFPKFIIEDDALIIGKVKFHKQLAFNENDIKGGGMWEWDKEGKTFMLYGESHDFGSVKIGDLRKCIESGNVFLSYYGGRKIVDHTFYFNTGSEIIKITSTNQSTQNNEQTTTG